MKHLLPTLFAGLFCAGLLAQNFKTVNSFTAGNTGTDEIRDITTDAQGNIYITGSFTDSVDFDPGPGTFYLTTPMGNKPDAFIQKLDANGNFLWAKSFRGTFNDIESGYRLAVDDTGNVFLLGYFQRNIFFDVNGYQWPGNVNAIGNRPFITKLDSLGNVKWGMGWQHSSASETLQGYDIKLMADGNIAVVGLYTGTVDFDPTINSILNRTSNGGYDIYIQKIASSGSVLKAISIGGTNNDWGRSLSIVGTDLIISGAFRGTTDFDNSASIASRTSNGSDDCFILKLDSAFDFVFVKTFGGSSIDWISNTVISSGYLYAAGVFSSSVDFDPNQSNDSILTSFGSTDIFIAKYDLQGDFVWVRQFGGTDEDRSYSMHTSTLGLLSFTGYFKGIFDSDPNSNQTNYLNSSGQRDAFLVQIDSLGNLMGSASFGGINDDVIWATHFSSSNKIYAGGSFQNTIDLDPTPNTNLVTSNGQEDMMFLELGLCAVQQDTIPVLACNQFVNPADSTVQSTNGFYTGNFLASDGCDSTVVFDVTINTIAPSVTQTIDGLAAQTQATNPTYQWLDCTTNQIIPGATNQTYMPMVNGLYAVIVSSGTCTDTSSCYTINNVALPETLLQNSITLYPNPTNGLLRIESAQPWQKAEVIDLMGRTILSQNQPQEELDLTLLASGIYLVKVYFSEGVVVQRVVRG